MSDAEELTDPTMPSAVSDVGERSAGDGRESSHDDSPDVTTDDELDELPDHHHQQHSTTSSSSSTAAAAAAAAAGSGKNSATNASVASAATAYATVASEKQTEHSASPRNRASESGGGGMGNGGGGLLPWGARKELPTTISAQLTETNIRPGEYVMRTLFSEFTVTVEKKIEVVIQEPLERIISKSLQRGEDTKFDQLVMAFGSVAEHCLPSLLKALFDWYNRQGVADWGAPDPKGKADPNKSKGVESSSWGGLAERRDLAVEFVLCLVLIEVLKQLPVHPGHDELVHTIEDLAFKHFRHREGVQSNPNCANINVVADLYAEVIGILAQSRFQSVRRRFMHELKELRGKEASAHTTHNITALLMGMKFFRVKMVPIEEFEASFQFMQECAQYFLEVRDKDIKHGLAGLFVEILVPVAAAVKNEVNVPCLKNFVEMLYSSTLDTATKNKHKLAIFPLLTCLLCVSQKIFFLSNWHYFLTMCLQHLKNRDPKMARVALESLYRLLWVYMIRIKCESNSATHSRLASIVSSLFPKGSKTVVPRDTPLNIFVKIIQFIAQERLDFAMSDIMFDLLSVGRPIKVILSPERMAIGLRAFLVVADSLQQKEGDPPMPRTLAVLPSGNTLRVKKTFLSKMLTEDTARNIGLAAYYPLVRKAFNDILKALDNQFGKPLMMTNTQNVNKEPDELIGGERKAKMDLLRTCVAAVPRLIPDGMTGQELVEMLARLTVHMDEELRALAFQSLQALVIDFPEWRHEVIYGFIQFIVRDVGDAFPQLLDASLRMLLQLYTAWRTSLSSTTSTSSTPAARTPSYLLQLQHLQLHQRGDDLDMVCLGEAVALVLMCACRSPPRRLAVLILKELKQLTLCFTVPPHHTSLLDAMDKHCSAVVESVSGQVGASERGVVTGLAAVDLQWLAERSANVWTGGNSDVDKAMGQQPQLDVWPQVLLGFLAFDCVLLLCPRVVVHMWPLVYTRAMNLYPTIDPLQPNDNRASLLRSATTLKKPVCERDLYLNLWRNYVVVACRVVPPVYTVTAAASAAASASTASSSTTPLQQRCASPDISVGSSPDSGVGTGSGVVPGGGVGVSVAPPQLYKLLVPLLRCDLTEVRDVASLALGNINHHALSDLMEELVPNVRESLDRKQENMRRRRRRDTLRVQLMKLFNTAATAGTFALSESVIDNDTGALLKHYLDYLDGARTYLENDSDRDNALLTQIKVLFCKFVKRLIKSFTLEQHHTLIPRTIRRGLFCMFVSWSGPFGLHFGYKLNDVGIHGEELEESALEASVAVLCCGAVYVSSMLSEEATLYQWLDAMLVSEQQQVRQLAHAAIVLLLEFNPDCGALLDWLVEKCYTSEPRVGDDCFSALATIFSAREYPCDRYIAIMTVSLLYTACPRTQMQETALQLLQILDTRFFGTRPAATYNELGLTNTAATGVCSTLDVFLTTTYSRSHLYLSKQLAHLHPELTMPIFSEISCRLQTARSSVRQLLFSCLLPWLFNMELMDSAMPPAHQPHSGQYYADAGLRREGWGSVEATEMVLNNLFYITAKFGEEHPKEVEELWAALCSCWPNNLRVIIRYLLIVVGMAPNNLLPHAQRVAVSIGIARPDRLVEELMVEMGCVETLCLIERTETPPFYRVTAVRKCSGGQEEGGGGVGVGGKAGEGGGGGSEAGTLHTKRHSGDHHDSGSASSPMCGREQRSAPGSLRSISSLGSGVSSVIAVDSHNNPNSNTITPASAAAAATITRSSRPASSLAPNSAATSNNMEDSATEDAVEDNFTLMRRSQQQQHQHHDSYHSYHPHSVHHGGEEGTPHYQPPQPHPLPMPEYGGYFAPLTEYLPDSSQPITAFHRCYLSVLLMCEVLVAGIDADCHSVDWSVHVPLMLHIIVLGLDHSRPIVHQHCKRLLVHLLTVVADHRDHLGIARVLLNRKTCALNYKLIPHNTFQHNKHFTDNIPTSSLPVAEANNSKVAGTGDNSALVKTDGGAVELANNSGSGNTATPAKGTSMQTSVEGTLTEGLPSLDSELSEDEDATATTTTNSTTDAAPAATSAAATDSAIAAGSVEQGEQTRAVSNASSAVPPSDELQYSIKALVDFIAASDNQPLWNYEDITPKQLTIRSAQQLANFVRHVVSILSESLPHSHLEERLAQIALQVALSCSSRHYAGRSLQVLRCLHVSLSSRMLSELLGRLVETVAEQGEDMQGYVTELMLTLEAAVDALHSDFRPIEFVRELFKSTPNLNKERKVCLGGVLGSMAVVGSHYPPLHRLGHSHHTANYPLIAPGSPGHLRSTSFSVSYARGKHIASPTADIRVSGEMRGRSGTDSDARFRQQQQQQLSGGSLSRSRSAQSLKMLADQTNDDKLAVLSQLFWIAVSLLESDYDYEFLLATRLLEKVLSRLPLDRPDALDKLEKLQQQLKWKGFPGVHALLLKGCTSPTLYEPAVSLLASLTRYTHLQVIDPSQSRAGFAMNVIALLPYMLHHYEDANALCIQAAENIAKVSQECSDEGKQLQNLATVMTLYSRRNFSKESFQWTKCVVKYLHDSYAQQASALLAFLVEILEKGPAWVQSPVLNIVYCLLHYTDINSPPHTAALNADLLSVIAKHMEGVHWKEALRILKLAVTGSSSLVLPPSTLRSGLPTASPTRGDAVDHIILMHTKKELPGRTMEFTFDVTQTPIIGRRYLQQSQQPCTSGTVSSTASSTGGASSSATAGAASEPSSITVTDGASTGITGISGITGGISGITGGITGGISGITGGISSITGGISGITSGLTGGLTGMAGLSQVSPRRTSSFSPYDVTNSQGTGAVPWKRPWQSQARVRECLVKLLNTCGQRVGLPKSPSDGNISKVIFSQSSELERQSSMASSTEEVSAGAAAGEDRTPADDITSSENQFAVFKDFDFLEYELESQGEESVDNFNLWGVRRRSPTNSSAPPAEAPAPQPTMQQQQPPAPPSPPSPPSPPPEPDWWDEDGSVSPVDDTSIPSHTTEPSAAEEPPAVSTPTRGGLATPTSGEAGSGAQPGEEGAQVTGRGSSSSRGRRRRRNSPHVHPPNNLRLNTSAAAAVAIRRPPSRSSISDESSEGDLGELTPCNAPVNLLFPTRPPVQPLHSSWRSHLTSLTQINTGLSTPAYSCALFSTLFAECVGKTCSAVREASPLLGQLGSATASLVGHLEAVACVSPLPYVYLDGALLDMCGLQSKVRASFIALHEHTDTFLDKLDTALMVVDALKGSVMKVPGMSDSEDSVVSRGCSEEQQVEVCRALYRLHFQVSLMYDTYAKTLLLLLHAARHAHAQVTDHSVELSALRGKLVAAAEQLDATPPCSPPPCTPVSPHQHHYAHQNRDVPEGEECETDSVGETDVYSLEEDVGGESTSSLISSYHPPPVLPSNLPTPTHSSSTSTYQPASFPTPTLSTSSTLPLLATPTHSTASTLPRMPTLPQANHKVLQLVANQKWKEVVQYSDDNSSVWQQPGMPHHNITTVLNIYCTYLAEKQPGMIAVCCTEPYLSETSQHLADANLAALGILRLMENEQLQYQGNVSLALSSSTAAQYSGQHSTIYSTAPVTGAHHVALFSTVANTTPPQQHQPHSPTSSQQSTLQSVYCHPSSLSSQHTPQQQSTSQPLQRSGVSSPQQSPHSSISCQEVFSTQSAMAQNDPFSQSVATLPLSPQLSDFHNPMCRKFSQSSPTNSSQQCVNQQPLSPQNSSSLQQPLSPDYSIGPQQPINPQQSNSSQETLSPQRSFSVQQPLSPQLPPCLQQPLSSDVSGTTQVQPQSHQQPSSPLRSEGSQHSERDSNEIIGAETFNAGSSPSPEHIASQTAGQQISRRITEC